MKTAITVVTLLLLGACAARPLRCDRLRPINSVAAVVAPQLQRAAPR